MTTKKVKTKTKKPTLRGKGDYEASTVAIVKPLERLEAKIDHIEKKLVGSAMSKATAASTIGRTLGNFVNQGDLGALAGSTMAKFFGHGDYAVKSNSLMKGSASAAAGAKFHSERRGTRITEREFIGEVVSGSLSGASTAFTLLNMPLNPTSSLTFPWLSQIAVLYDQWEPHGIVFEFVSTSSEFNGSSQALGSVVMATEYDPYDPAFADKQAMENSDYSCSTKPAVGLLHGIECDQRERPTPVLYTDLNNGAPLSSSTLGTFGIATQGCSVAGVTLGELWVSYDITFYKKQLVPPTIPSLYATGQTAVTTGLLAAPTVSSSNTITITQNLALGSVINFNNQRVGNRYLVCYFMSVQGTSDVINNWTPVNGTVTRNTVNGSGAIGMVDYIFTTTGTNSTLTTSKKISAATAFYEAAITQIAPGATPLWGA